ncbi:MAG: hypothetical protein KKC64_15700 [Spirochaetes bacterium]|nr:hypothetical protein [Spirochaetota bacterium]
MGTEAARGGLARPSNLITLQASRHGGIAERVSAVRGRLSAMPAGALWPPEWGLKLRAAGS